MTKKLTLLLLASATLLYAGKGKIRVASDVQGAYIYVDGKKKAMTGEGFTSILLEEGEHNIKVEKVKDDGEWKLSKSKKIFIGEETSLKINFILSESIPSKKRIHRRTLNILKNQKFNTVVDKKTNLTWMRCSLGQLWNRSVCVGKPLLYTSKEIVSIIKIINEKGYSLRLPTMSELDGLIVCPNNAKRVLHKINGREYKLCNVNNKVPVINLNKFPNTKPNYYLTSEFIYKSYSSDSKKEFSPKVVNFANGYSGTYRGDIAGYVRLIDKK